MARPTPDILGDVRAQTPDDLETAIFGPPRAAAGLHDIPVDLIDDNPWQPRQDYDGIEELAADIARNGLLQAPKGRRTADGRVQLQFGHRRLRAVRQLGWRTMPVEIQTIVEDRDMAIRAWVENHNRQDFTPLDQARYFRRLMDEGWTQQQIADQLGLARPTISNAVRLLQLPEAVQAQVAEAGLSARQAEALVSLTQLPAEITEEANCHWNPSYRPTEIIKAALDGASSDEIRRRTKDLITRHTTPVHDEPWYRHEFPTRKPAMVAPRCDECPSAIKRDAGVFCPNHACYTLKFREWEAAKLTAASLASGIPIADHPVLSSTRHEDFTFTGDAGQAVLAQTPRCKNMRLVTMPPNLRRSGLVALEGHPEAILVCQKGGNNQCACLTKARKTASDVPNPNHTPIHMLHELQKPCIALLAEQLATIPPGLLAIASQRFHFAYETELITSTDGPDAATKLAERALNSLSIYNSVEKNRRLAEQIMALADLRAPWLPPVDDSPFPVL